MIGRMAAVVAALLTLVALVDAQPKPARPFTFILDFLPYGEYTPYSGDTIKRIAVGQGEAGSADFSALTGARANEDIRVKAIAAYFRRPPHSIFVREGTGINGDELYTNDLLPERK